MIQKVAQENSIQVILCVKMGLGLLIFSSLMNVILFSKNGRFRSYLGYLNGV